MPLPDFLDKRCEDFLRRSWGETYRKGGADAVRREARRICYTPTEIEALLTWLRDEVAADA